jgi:hypothetical protein
MPLTSEQVQQFRRDGFLLVKDVFKPEVLELYAKDVRAATSARGDSLLPNADECQNRVDVHVRSKEKREMDELQAQGKPVPEDLKRRRDAKQTRYGNQRMIIKYRNKRAFLKGYKAALEKRRRVAAARGYHVPEDDVERQLREQDEAEARYKAEVAARNKRTGEAGDAAAGPDEVKEGDSGCGGDADKGWDESKKTGESPSASSAAEEEGRKAAEADAKVGYDERTQEHLTRSQLEERANQFIDSPDFRKRVDEKMHVTDVNRFFSQMGQAWVHLWHGDAALRQQVTGPLGGALGRAAAELGGFSKARLFTDQATAKRPWNNAHPVHCMAPFVDFIDMRAVAATVVLPKTPLDRRHGAFVMLPGSHNVLRRVSDDGRDVSLFKSMPASWDTAEWVRAIPELKRIEPVEVHAGPNDVLFTHTHMGFCHLPNMSPEGALTHTLFLMPDGVVFTGVKSTWMTMSRDGPLRHYEAGQPLRDDAVFPLLYDALGAE